MPATELQLRAIIAKLLREIDSYRIMCSQPTSDGLRTILPSQLLPFTSLPATVNVDEQGAFQIRCES